MDIVIENTELDVTIDKEPINIDFGTNNLDINIEVVEKQVVEPLTPIRSYTDVKEDIRDD